MASVAVAGEGGFVKVSVTGAARAFSNPTRLLIVSHLLGEGGRASAHSFSQLYPALRLGNVDYHLKKLRRVGVLRRLPERMRLTDTSRPEWVYDAEGTNAGPARDVLDVFQGRKGMAGGKGDDPLRFPVGEDELLLLARLLTNPLRVRVILALHRRHGELFHPPKPPGYSTRR